MNALLIIQSTIIKTEGFFYDDYFPHSGDSLGLLSDGFLCSMTMQI